MHSEVKSFSQKLRKEATPEENHLWYDFLKDYPVQFRRQVWFGPYILDFYCAKAKLGIELDGSQHYTEETKEYDERRSNFLGINYQIRLIRFSNLDMKQNFEGVCLAIHQEVKRRSPSSAPSGGTFPPEGGRLHGQEVSMKTVTIYTDGACSGNPGPGGWGAILMYGPHKKELSGGEAQTTNNRMELTGVITALEKGWAKGWRARGWVKGDKKPALNPDLWARLLELYEYHTVNLHWVKGHASNPYNNRCDELAVAESRKFK